MITSALYTLISGIPKKGIAPKRWKEVWSPLPKHIGYSLKLETGKKPGTQAIYSLYVYDDSTVFVGFGDAFINDGPTALVSINPNTGKSTYYGIHGTEAFQIFRTIDGKVYAPFVDPIEESSVPYTTYPPEENTPSPINGIHFFDIIKFDEKLWVSGSERVITSSGKQHSVGVVWWSSDDGVSWNRTTPSGIVGDSERIYRLGVINNRLYSCSNQIWTTNTDSKHFSVWVDGGWSTTTNPGPDPNPINIAPPSDSPNPLTGAYAKTSTHWLVGTIDGDIYVRSIDELNENS